MVVVFVERAEHELHVHADLELLGVGGGRELAEHDHPLASSSTAHTVYGTNGSGATYGSGGA